MAAEINIIATTTEELDSPGMTHPLSTFESIAKPANRN
jgi:hypothetical protein